MRRPVAWTRTVTFFEDDWHEGNVPIMGPRTHAAWLCTSVFDGARAFEGVAPDLDLHCARVNESAKAMWLKPLVPTEAWVALVREGLTRFERDAELYIRPMYWAEEAAVGAVRHDPQLDPLVPHTLHRAISKACGHRHHAVALSAADARMRRSRSQSRLPLSEQCTRALEASSRGFDNCLLCDMLGNIAEVGTANIFMAKDGGRVVAGWNGTFLPASRGRGSWLCCARPAPPWSRRRCAIPIFSRQMRFFPPAITPRCRRLRGSTSGICNRARSI